MKYILTNKNTNLSITIEICLLPFKIIKKFIGLQNYLMIYENFMEEDKKVNGRRIIA